MMTKWGWHIIDDSFEPAYLNRLGRAAAIKLVVGENGWKRAQELRQLYPGKPIVLRLIHLEGPAKPATPQAMIAEFQRWRTEYGLVDCWFQTLQNMPEMDAAAAAWDAEALRLARPLGLCLVVGDWSMGKSGVTGVWPGEDRWPTQYDVFREVVASGPNLAVLGYQLYIGNGQLAYGEGWRSLPLRYQDVHRVHLAPNGWGSATWCGTEAGFDAGNMEQEGVSPEEAAGAMIDLDRDWWAPDARLRWSFAYTLDKSTWASHGFDMRPIFDPVTAYQRTTPAPVPQPSPSPQPPPIGDYRSAMTLGTLNQRAAPSSTSAYLGQYEVGARVVVSWPPENNYVAVTGQGCWIYTGSGRLKFT